MRLQQKRQIRSWMAYLVLALTTLATTGCAKLYHATHYNAVTEAINEHRRPYYHSSHTGRIIAKKHGKYQPVEPPCYGYEPTCWQAWPLDCPNCPPPDRVMSDQVSPESAHDEVAKPMPATPPHQQDPTGKKDDSSANNPPAKQPLPEDIERILKEPLPPKGDEEPIIPQGSIDRDRSFEFIGTEAATFLGPRAVTALIAPEPMTRLPKPLNYKQLKIGSLIAEDSLLNRVHETAVNIQTSQPKQQVAEQKPRPIHRQRRPANLKIPKPVITLTGSGESTALSSRKARWQQPAAQKNPVAQTDNVQSPKEKMQPQKPESSERKQLLRITKDKLQKNDRLTPVGFPLNRESSRRMRSLQPLTHDESISAKPGVNDENSQAEQQADQNQDAEIPIFRISTAKQSKRSTNARERLVPAGEPKRLIRFISNEDDADSTEDLETLTVPDGPSSLKFR